jgi:poly-gamma-glutamate capsule biosynthesis protein CapA/YwtB (metallophosphatase superfamily)
VSTTTASFLTGGDVAPMRERGTGMLGEVAALFRAAEVTFVNLEHALSVSGGLTRGRERFHRGPPNNADGLAEAGLSCVNIANNHVFDYGDESFFETLEELDRRSIPHFGAGANLAEARKPVVITRGKLRVGFLGYTTTLPRGFAATDSTPGVNPLNVRTAYEAKRHLAEYPGVAPHIVTMTEPADLRRLREDVTALAAQADVILVYVHWGTSMTPYVHDFQTEIGHAAIDAGAHAVFGGHQHVICAVEFYRGCPIVHGSGNLLFDKWEPFFTEETLKTFLFGATLEPGKVRDIYALPVKNGVNTPPSPLPQSDPMWQQIYRELETRSQPFATQVAVDGDRIVLSA